MRAVVQRVSRGEVRVDGEVVGRIGPGLLAYIGAAEGDSDSDLTLIAEKIANLRIFEDAHGKMNLSVVDVGGGILAVPAFTTMGDARKGRRPAFIDAARPESACSAFDRVVELMQQSRVKVATGRFREHMEVDAVNDGPICILLDSRKAF